MPDGEPLDPNAWPPYSQPPWPYPPGQYAPGQYAPGQYPPGQYPQGHYTEAPYPHGQPGYPPAYPTYSGQPGYPAPPYPGGALRPVRPGTVMSAAVLSFVTAGLLVIAAMVLLTSLSAVNDFDTTDQFRSTTAEFGMDGLLNLLAAALLVTGGVKLVASKRSGRLLVWLGAGLTVCYAFYWMMRVDEVFGVAFWAALFGALAIIAACLAGSATARQWLDTEPATPQPPPKPY